MNNKIDDILISLMSTKYNIENNRSSFKSDDSYSEIIGKLNDMITDYTLQNKMSAKDIVDCALTLVDNKKENKFQQKINKFKENLKLKNIYKNIKNKVQERIKKKEDRQKYSEELEELIKEKLKDYLNEKDIVEDINNIKDKDKEKSMNKDLNKKDKKVPFYNKVVAEEFMKDSKDKSFIYKDDNKYFVCRKEDGNVDIKPCDNLRLAYEELTGKRGLSDNTLANSIIDKTSMKFNEKEMTKQI